MGRITDEAIDVLAARFPTLDWTLHDIPGTAGAAQGWAWLGGEDESVMMCVFKGREIHEAFHRQDFFFFNYAYRGSFDAVSQQQGNRITVRENEMVAGQPFTGYALDGSSETEIVNVGTLVRKELFYRKFLPLISGSRRLLHFFLEPESNLFSNDFLHVSARRGFPYREILNLMIVEYAHPSTGSQDVLQSLALALTIYLARQYEEEHPVEHERGSAGEIVDYIAAHASTATLEETARHFGYHPNYLSTLLREKTGSTFVGIRTEQRMKRADLLLRTTDLSVEEIAAMLGYSSTSNFYRVFRERFGHSPREQS